MHPQPLAVALADQAAGFMGLATEDALQVQLVGLGRPGVSATKNICGERSSNSSREYPSKRTSPSLI